MSNEAPAICYVLGFLFVVGGFVAYVYELRSWFGLVITHPYRDLGITLIVLGVVLIIVGAILSFLKKEKEDIPSNALLSKHQPLLI